MIEQSHGPGLPPEEANGFLELLLTLIEGGISPKHLENDSAGNVSVCCQVHFPHASTSKRAYETIVSNVLSFEEHLFHPLSQATSLPLVMTHAQPQLV
jgi:hypothetical protein